MSANIGRWESRGAAFAAATALSIAERVVTVGEDILQQVDAITDDLRRRVPGGSFISFAVDVALLPGRGLVAVARSSRKHEKGPQIGLF